MIYALVIFLSFIACVMGFISEVTAGNITHLKNGRKPEAGATVFPTIPIMQLLTVLVTWGLNRIHPPLGFYTVSALFVVFALFWVVSYRKLKREFDELNR